MYLKFVVRTLVSEETLFCGVDDARPDELDALYCLGGPVGV